MEDYTLKEVNLFFAACLKREETDMQKGAIAARVAQADEKGWKSFMDTFKRNVDKISRHQQKGKKQDVDAFFSRISGLPSMARVREEVRNAREEGRDPHIGDALQRKSVKVQEGRRRPPEPTLPKAIRRIQKP